MLIVVDLAKNVLRFVPEQAPPAASAVSLPATVDVGERGELLGVEIGLGDHGLGASWRTEGAGAIELDPSGTTCYLAIGEARGDEQRSAQARIAALRDASGTIVAFELPRRAPGYEISYPSGNQ
jgi:hypothetical protein